MIELNEELRQAVSDHPGEPIELVDPATRQTFVLLRADEFQRMKELIYDDSPWTAEEKATLAGRAFGKDDDTDYGEYVRDKP
jgi:hypothetical protein